MQLISAHCILVRPPATDAEEDDQLACTRVQRRESLWTLLSKVFGRAAEECEIEIAFKHSQDGTQTNPCRSLLTDYIANRREAAGLLLAERLKSVTNRNTGAGLLFLLYGEEGETSRLVLSRFPAGEGIIAEHREGQLHVEFIKRVFTRNERTYKAALYEGKPSPTAFWRGKVIDRQMNDHHSQVAEYWIDGFLASSLKTTSKAGTMRLANALRLVSDTSTSTDVKSEVISAAQLVARFRGRVISINQFCEESGFSPHTVEAIRGAVGQTHLLSDGFRLDQEEFQRLVAFRTIELNNGAVLTAATDRFEEVFDQEETAGGIRFSTEGAVVDDKLRRRK